MDVKEVDDLLNRARRHPKRTAVLVVGAVLVAIVASFGSGYFSQLGSNLAGGTDLDGRVLLDRQVAEAELVDLALRSTFSPDAAANLRLLADAGLISDPAGAIRKLKVAPESSTRVSVLIASAEGTREPIELDGSQPARIAWQSKNATACRMLSPSGMSGTSLSGVMNIEPGHPWYPSPGSVRAISISCTDGTSIATDVVLFQRQA